MAKNCGLGGTPNILCSFGRDFRQSITASMAKKAMNDRGGKEADVTDGGYAPKAPISGVKWLPHRRSHLATRITCSRPIPPGRTGSKRVHADGC